MNRFTLYCFILVISQPIFVSSIFVSLVQSDDRPNIVFMLSDDQGWNGLSVAMHPQFVGAKSDFFKTPNIERLASQGMRFSAAYAPSPVCSPTRISLLTGKSPAQLHWTKAAPPESGRMLIEPGLIKSISNEETTIAELLRDAGYATAHYGKWHIAGGGPDNHGFEEHDGDTGNENAYQFSDPNPVDIFGMAERSAKFMKKNSEKNKPFFIQLSWNALHASENALKATKAKYQQALNNRNEKQISTAAITEDLDTGVGMVMSAIDELELGKNTYVIYMSDNGSGGGGKRGGLSGGKGSLWEGGIRVPLIIRGPNIKPASWCHTQVVGYDLFPTYMEWAKIDSAKLPRHTEGGSLTKVIYHDSERAIQRPREEVVFHFPHYQNEHTPHSVIYLDNFKLIYFYENKQSKLFDIAKDISEKNDLATTLPEKAEQLRVRLENYLSAIRAQLPTVNADFHPNPAIRTKRKNGNRPK